MSTWNGKYLSIKSIIEKAYRDTGSIYKIDFYDAIEWAGECIELIGSPIQLIDKHECIEIEEFKGKLPCDMHLLLGTREKETKTVMRYSTDSFHHSLVCQDINNECMHSDITYTINNDYMFTSFEEGTVEIVYKALPTDDQGFPLIPDNIKFVKAVKSYIEERIYWRALNSGKVQQFIYQKAETDRDWYLAAANSTGNKPSVDMMESIKNSFLRLIPKINEHASAFKHMGEAEQRYTHNSKFNGRGGDNTDNETFSHRG